MQLRYKAGHIFFSHSCSHKHLPPPRRAVSKFGDIAAFVHDYDHYTVPLPADELAQQPAVLVIYGFLCVAWTNNWNLEID
jgi:hypothetical protein